MKAKPGRADELVQALLKVKGSVESEAEPDGISFRVAQFQDEILLFEEYVRLDSLPRPDTSLTYMLSQFYFEPDIRAQPH